MNDMAEGISPRKLNRLVQNSDRKRGSVWCLPPAVLREPDEMLEAVQILVEFPTETGALLWKALRSVTLWAQTPEHQRDLFAANAPERRLKELRAVSMDAGLEVPLTSLVPMVNNPSRMTGDLVCHLCLAIGSWAEEHQALGTAVAFTQAAALSAPEDAEAAFRVGRLTHRWGRLSRAETWLRRTVGIARRSHDWGIYARAHAAIGAIFAERDAPVEARRYYRKALKAARRHGQLLARADALHGLSRLAHAAGAVEEAIRLARAALRGYGSDERAALPVRMDLASLALARGQQSRAVGLLEHAFDVDTDARSRASALALLAEASATTDAVLYERAWNAAWQFAEREPHGNYDLIIDLAQAAASKDDWLYMNRALGSLAGARLSPDAERALDELSRRREAAQHAHAANRREH